MDRLKIEREQGRTINGNLAHVLINEGKLTKGEREWGREKKKKKKKEKEGRAAISPPHIQ